MIFCSNIYAYLADWKTVEIRINLLLVMISLTIQLKTIIN
jgi:hypothetical protein